MVMSHAKSVFASKTMWFNVLMGASQIAQTLVEINALTGTPAVVVTVIGNMLLRMITDQPVALTKKS